MSTMNFSLNLDSRNCHGFPYFITVFRKYCIRLGEVTVIGFSIISPKSSVVIAESSYLLNSTRFQWQTTKNLILVCVLIPSWNQCNLTNNFEYQRTRPKAQQNSSLVICPEGNRNFTAISSLWEKSRRPLMNKIVSVFLLRTVVIPYFCFWL